MAPLDANGVARAAISRSTMSRWRALTLSVLIGPAIAPNCAARRARSAILAVP
jgi:hypothetical protein